MTEINNQSNRPDWYEGILVYDGEEYSFFTGDPDSSDVSSMPYGTYGPLYKPTHPEVQKSTAHCDAIQWAKANEIFDPKHQRNLDSEHGYGMSRHVIGTPHATNGCLAIHRHEWPKLTKKLQEAIDHGEKLYIHISLEGVFINKEKQG